MRAGPGDRATRTAYDTVARDYARLVPDMSLEAPLDRAVPAAFAEMLAEDTEALVAEVGCGAGQVPLVCGGLPAAVPVRIGRSAAASSP